MISKRKIARLTRKLDDLEKSISPFTGYAYAVVAGITNTISVYIMKNVTGYHPFQVIQYRCIAHSLFSYIFVSISDSDFYFTDHKINTALVTRGVLGSISVVFFYIGLFLLEGSEAIVISQTMPVMVGILAAIILNEKYELAQFIAAIMCIGGVVLIAKPSFIFADEVSENPLRGLGVVAMLGNCFLMAFNSCLVKKIGGKANIGIINLYFGVCATLFASLITLLVEVKVPSFRDLIYIAIHSFLFFLFQIMMNRGFVLGRASKVSIMSYLNILYALGFEFFIVGKVPDGFSMLGSGLIFCCLFVYLYHNYLKEQTYQKKKSSLELFTQR